MKELWADVEAVARLARTFHEAERSSGTRHLATSSRKLPESDHYRLHGVSAPAVLATGDFTDAVALDASTLVLAIADVSGKGVQAALVTAVARSILGGLVGSGEGPAVILARLDRLLHASRLGSIYMTIFLGRYDARSGRLRYANAGHPHPLKITASRQVRPAGRVTGPILGILETPGWQEDEIELGPRERLVLYTDGAVEAMSPRGRFFGERRLRRLLSGNAALPLAAMCGETARALDDFQAGRRSDDMTLLALQRRMPAAEPAAGGRGLVSPSTQ